MQNITGDLELRIQSTLYFRQVKSKEDTSWKQEKTQKVSNAKGLWKFWC